VSVFLVHNVDVVSLTAAAVCVFLSLPSCSLCNFCISARTATAPSLFLFVLFACCSFLVAAKKWGINEVIFDILVALGRRDWNMLVQAVSNLAAEHGVYARMHCVCVGVHMLCVCVFCIRVLHCV